MALPHGLIRMPVRCWTASLKDWLCYSHDSYYLECKFFRYGLKGLEEERKEPRYFTDLRWRALVERRIWEKWEGFNVQYEFTSTLFNALCQQ